MKMKMREERKEKQKKNTGLLDGEWEVSVAATSALGRDSTGTFRPVRRKEWSRARGRFVVQRLGARHAKLPALAHRSLCPLFLSSFRSHRRVPYGYHQLCLC